MINISKRLAYEFCYDDVKNVSLEDNSDAIQSSYRVVSIFIGRKSVGDDLILAWEDIAR